MLDKVTLLVKGCVCIATAVVVEVTQPKWKEPWLNYW